MPVPPALICKAADVLGPTLPSTRETLCLLKSTHGSCGTRTKNAVNAVRIETEIFQSLLQRLNERTFEPDLSIGMISSPQIFVMISCVNFPPCR